ncbi:TPA: TIGR00269 family protein [Candidatus Woesearchaeota archaeon]|nr:MAG: hypothetical protein QT07_C0007G0003 [archaeon GW2011_AR16]HIG96067.1 TIGR00269 family protein [Candidatus Woesearchaeota archaeon]
MVFTETGTEIALHAGTSCSSGTCGAGIAQNPVQSLTPEDQRMLAAFRPETVEAAVKKTIETYKLFSYTDKILVACSGGKDSTVILHMLKKFGYAIEAITVNAHIGCYTDENLRNLREMCAKIDVKLHEISFRKEFGKSLCYIQSILKAKGYDYKNCHTCGVLRRYLLNKYSKPLHPDVIVTGHNLDDEAQAVMMNLFRGNLQVCARIGPKTGMVHDSKTDHNSATKKKFVQRVKPLYFVRESDVVKYSKLHNFPVYYGECPCSSDTYRREMKDMFKSFGEQRDEVKEHIIKSFISISEPLKAHFMQAEGGAIQECLICGEPSSKDICNTCALLAKLRDNKIIKS